MKKTANTLLVIMLILGMSMVSVGGGTQLPKLFVDPPTYNVTLPDEVFTININVSNVENLAGFNFTLSYNTTLLDALDVVDGHFIPKPVWRQKEINDSGGYIKVSIMCLFPSIGVSGSGTLATVTFKATHTGSAQCALHLYDTALIDSKANLITHDVEDGNCEFAILKFTVATDKHTYSLGETVEIRGNLTLDGSLYPALMALEVTNPEYSVVMRTLETGATPPGDITILDVVPCDMLGNPRSSFMLGEQAYFNVTIRNSGTETKLVTITINTYDGEMVSLGVKTGPTNASVPPGTWPGKLIAPEYIPDWAHVGTGTVYASAFTNFPKYGGTPYCPEKSATFQIISGALGASSLETQTSDSSPTVRSLTQNTGNYSLTFKLPPEGAQVITGIHRVYAAFYHKARSIKRSTAFGVKTVLCVPDQFGTIQAAVNAANSTYKSILVLPQTYSEHVTINKTVTLVGVDPTTTIIDGSGTGTVVTITADNAEISWFTIKNGGSSFPNSGIALSNSYGGTVSENTILGNYYGIMIDSSDNNDFLGNTLSNNNYGIYLNHSTSTTLKNNIMVCNRYNFGVFGDSSSDFTHNIDTTNTVDGKPIIYWTNQYDRTVPTDAGFVAIVNSAKIATRGLNLNKNVQGVVFAFATDSLIERVSTTNNYYGIYMVNSTGNTIVGGTVLNNSVGIHQRYSSQNMICHNNFINNTNQVDLYQSSNTWDDNAGKGNYWDDYNGTDTTVPPDGVGDEYLPWQGVDWYPLMYPRILVHDVAIINVTPVLPYNVTQVFPGWVVDVTVTFKNKGDFTQTFNVAAYYNETAITLPNGENYTTVTDLIPQEETALTFTWDTTNVPVGDYTISANTTIAIDDYPSDNTLVDGKVYVRLIGDVDGNNKVNVMDMLLLKIAITLGKTVEECPFCDVDGNGKVNVMDMLILKIIITLTGAGG